MYMEPILDKIARNMREMENAPLYKRVMRFIAYSLLVLVVVLYICVAVYAYVEAKQKHTGVEFPSGRGFAVCVFFGFSAMFAYSVFAGLKSGVVSIGKFGSIIIRRKTDTFVFYLAIAGLIAVSLVFFYEGVNSMFAT
jgi:magnesium-transporting ATPase (P-type)